jgi:hypothetical protein
MVVIIKARPPPLHSVTPSLFLSPPSLHVSMSVWLRGSIYPNLAVTASKCLFQSSTRWFFSLPLHHQRARSTVTAPAMPRPLTDEDRAHVQTFMDHLHKGMAAITDSDPDKMSAARDAAAKAYPISEDLREAYRTERLAETTDPLKVLNNPSFLKPDAPWGLVVYRVSYSDDAAWDRMLSVIREGIELSLALRPAQPDLSSRLELVVMDDQSKFDGAGPEKIREHLNSWSLDELQRNWRADREPATKDEITNSAGNAEYLFLAGSRYNFCFLVDAICLESLEKMVTPVIKLVNGNWAPDSEQDEAEEDEEDEKLNWEGGETNAEYEDVGWMYVDAYEYVTVQDEFHQEDNWSEMYVRPPLMRFEDDFNEAPGFWRRNASSA